MFIEDKDYYYYINSLGYFEKYSKKHKKFKIEKMEMCEPIYDKLKKYIYIVIDNKEYIIKNEIVRFFYRGGIDINKFLIYCKNGNRYDCNFENLAIVKKAQKND